ncbi:MerR family transcriptional regulator [Streptomyces sp. NPDC059092]|uniref:DNA polymerase III subunit beta family protein n=1 Tax=Streptomyces sp. NPDC059092 TaxID=3346725 RepID=UPI0036AA1FDF
MDSTTGSTPTGSTPVDISIGLFQPELLSISAFARRVGVAPSALRFYDDCGVLVPARVDATTGYRSYSLDQEMRARVLRSLREAGLPLAEVVVVLDGDPDAARTVLERHRGTVRERSRTADATIAAVLRSLPGAEGPDGADAEASAPGAGPVTRVRLGGAELAGAVRQVGAAVGDDPEHPVLGRVLVEIDESEVRLVATDRYRLSTRVLKPVVAVEGPDRRVLLDAGPLAEAGVWAARCAAVTVEVDADEARISDTDGSGSRELKLWDGEFPAYRDLLTELPEARHRLIVDRTALLDAITAYARTDDETDGGVDGGVDGETENGVDGGTDGRSGGEGAARGAPGTSAVALRLGEDDVHISPAERTDQPPRSGRSHDASTTLRALRIGETPLRIGFDPAVLAAALEASVGPDVLLEISAVTEPVVVRSADQGSFTTLVMPVALAATPED